MIFDVYLPFKVASFASHLQNKNMVSMSEHEYNVFCKTMSDNFHLILENKTGDLLNILWSKVGWQLLNKNEIIVFCNEIFEYFDLNSYDFNKHENIDGFIKKWVTCYLYNTENMSIDEISTKYESLLKRNDISSLHSVLFQIYIQDISPKVTSLEEIRKLTTVNGWM